MVLISGVGPFYSFALERMTLATLMPFPPLCLFPLFFPLPPIWGLETLNLTVTVLLSCALRVRNSTEHRSLLDSDDAIG